MRSWTVTLRNFDGTCGSEWTWEAVINGKNMAFSANRSFSTFAEAAKDADDSLRAVKQSMHWREDDQEGE